MVKLKKKNRDKYCANPPKCRKESTNHYDHETSLSGDQIAAVSSPYKENDAVTTCRCLKHIFPHSWDTRIISSLPAKYIQMFAKKACNSINISNMCYYQTITITKLLHFNHENTP